MHKVNFRHLCLSLSPSLFGCKNMHTESANIVIIINIIGIVVAFIACHMCHTCMYVCVCLSTKICFNPRVTLIPTLQCDAVQMHLVCCLSVCRPDCLSLYLFLSPSLLLITRVSDGIASLQHKLPETISDSKWKRKENRHKCQRAIERETARYRKRGNAAQAVAIFTVVLHNFLAHYVD